MLSKVIRPNNKTLLKIKMNRAFGTNPGYIHRIFNTLDKNTSAYGVARFDPTEPLKVSLFSFFRHS